MRRLLFGGYVCFYAHSAFLPPRAARCLSRRSGRWPRERRWRWVGCALWGRKPCGAWCGRGLWAVLERGLFQGCSSSWIRGELLQAFICDSIGCVIPWMPSPLNSGSLDSVFELANVVCELDRQDWITFFAAIILALITLFAGYDHVSILGAAFVDLPQQAGIPCLFAAVAPAFAEAQLASNDRQRSEAI